MMKKIGRLILFLIGIILYSVFSSCQQPTSPDTKPKSYTSEFPSTVGSYWKYVVYDSSFSSGGQFDSVYTDSFLVKLNDVKTISDTQSIETYLYIYSDTTDTVIVDIRPNKVIMNNAFRSFSSTYLVTISGYYIFPLKVNNGWGKTYPLGGDTSYVIGESTLTVPAGVFSNVFHIHRSNFQIGPVSQFNIDSWYVSKVGFIQFEEYQSNGPRSNKTYIKLVQFKIA